jgi:hypothetical protein
MDDIVEPSTDLHGCHEVYSAPHIRRDALASRMERGSVSRSLRTVKTKGMNAMPGSLRDKHQLIPDPRKCGLFFRDGFGRNVGSSFFPSSPRIGSFMRRDKRTTTGNKISRYRNCQAFLAWFKKQAQPTVIRHIAQARHR